ncbi:hypothetical protein ABZ070_01015 [Streptomyces sp. NPDC006283]|uniref:hypothetical protein n=1 Tax=Streptomyces sp. NPDC006283 TaxID=3156741 RepID=UPI0033BBACCF
MVTDRALASSEDMHEYLVNELNLALRRVGVYGELETSMWFLIGHLLVLERRLEVWEQQKGRWERQGAWSSTGVRGAFARYFPSEHSLGASSVYAEFARREGWLKPDRVLDAEAYSALRNEAGRWADYDRSWADVTAAFGPASIQIGGNNPRYGKTLGYVTGDPAQPMVAFHLWNGTDPGLQDWPSHEQPLLLAVRCGDGDFADSLTFTPQGQNRRPEGDGWEQCS